MVPRRASFSFFPDKTLWTMNWSVHQYQKPIIADPNKAPYHGNSVSLPLRIKVVIESPYSFTLWAAHMSIMAFHPPSSLRPIQRITKEPSSKIGVCRTDVLRTDSIPPMTVYMAVMITSARAATQKFMPNNALSARPPAITVTETLVST